MSRALRLLSLLLAFHFLGGHWVALQSVAWTRMTVAFAADMPVHEALLKAVSGEAPCEMCKAVRTGQEHETQQTVLSLTLKTEALLPTPTQIQPSCSPLPPNLFGANIQHTWISRLHPPSTPPPLA